MSNTLTLQINPTTKQQTAWDYLLDNKTTEIGYGGAARGGKSWLGNEYLTYACCVYHGTRWVLGRKELKNLKRTSLVTLFKVFQKHGIREGVHYNYNQQDSIIRFWTGSEILLFDLDYKPSDPLYLRLGGLEITGALVEESNEVKIAAINILKSRCGNQLNDKYNLKPLLIETFNPDKGHVYHKYYRPYKDGTLPPYRVFIPALPTDNPYVPASYIEELKRADKITRERLLYGNFEYDDDPARLFETDALTDLFTNSVDKSDTKYMSVDVARRGKDKTTIFFWRGWQVYKVIEIAKCGIDELNNRVILEAEREQIQRRHIIADEDGVGGGVVDYVKCKGFVGGSSAIEEERGLDEVRPNYRNLRAQCYFILSDRVNKGQIAVKNVSDEQRQYIIEELEQIKVINADKDQKLQIIPKDQIKENLGRSPDYADGLMMRCYFEVHDDTFIFSL